MKNKSDLPHFVVPQIQENSITGFQRSIMILKITIAFLLIFCYQSYAKVFPQAISMQAKSIHLEDVFKQIEKESDYVVMYKKDNLKKLAPLNVHADKMPLNDFMIMVLKGKGLTYTIEDKTIMISLSTSNAQSNKNQNSTLSIQQLIKGRILNEKGEAIAGATVTIKNSGRSTSTDVEGRFEILSTGPQAILLIRMVGYETMEILASKVHDSDLKLQVEISNVEEVIVVGYGTQKRSSMTAAVSTMKGEEISSVPTTNLSNNLGGRVSGVIVKQTTGEPGKDGSNIFVRGVSTTGASQPLLIVDGVPRSFQKLDPNSIESFTVLKDAAAVAPYGMAGANGVILVTTKRGKAGKPTFNYNGYVGFQNSTQLPEILGSYDYALLRNLAAENDGISKPYTEEELLKFKNGTEPDAYPSYDSPFDGLITKNSPMHSHSFDISGGSDRFRFFAGFGYQGQQGLWKTTNADRYNLTVNLDADVSPSTKISFNINGNIQKIKAPPSDLYDWGSLRIFELIKFSHPGLNTVHFFSNGMYGSYASTTIFGSGYDKTIVGQLFSQLIVNQKLSFIPGLSVKGTVAFDPSITNNKIWNTPLQLATLDKTQTPYVIKDGTWGNTKATLRQSVAQSSQLMFQGEVNYAKQIGNHNIAALAVVEGRSNFSNSLGAVRRNYNLLIDEISMGSSSSIDMSTSGISSMGRQVGMLYRISYDYKSKYLFETSGRYDGHYYFAPGKRFGFFPSVSAGWRLSEESFLKDNVSWVNNLKVRLSYGEVGALAGTPFQYLSTYSVVGPGYSIGGTGVQIVTERAEPNFAITWERAKKTDIGLEAAILNNFLELELDYFYEKRSNMLVTPDIVTPLEYGIGLSQVNAGVMENNGIEVAARVNYPINDKLKVSLGGTITYAKNKLLQTFENTVTFNNPNRRRTGRSLGMQFGYESLGYFLPEDFDANGNLKSGIAIQPWGPVKPGDIRYADVNQDGKIDINDEVPIGDPSTPQLIYGISPSIKYKSFTLDLLFQGAAKTNFYFFREAAWAFWNGMSANKDNFDYWKPDNLNAKNPRLTSAPTTNNTQTSSHWMQDVSYLRLKNATVAFDLPLSFMQKVKLNNAQVYLSGQNLLTWTKVKNIDPEVAYDRGNTYPQQKVVSVGFRLGF